MSLLASLELSTVYTVSQLMRVTGDQWISVPGGSLSDE